MNSTKQFISEIQHELSQLKIICQYFCCDHLISEIEDLIENLISYNDYELENILYDKYIQIRKNILYGSDFAKEIKSPNFKVNRYSKYDYERSFAPYNLENRVNKFDNKNTKTVVFRSGMSAIDVILKSLVRHFDLSRMQMIDCSFYFETKELLYNIYDRYFNINRITSYEELYQTLEVTTYNIIFLESVDINRPNERIDLNLLIKKISNSRSPLILIIDTTADIFNFNLAEFVSKINRDILVFEIKSGIKLGQLGLELANVGFVNLSTNSKYIDLKSIYQTLVAFRSITGCSILPYEEKLLSNEIFFSEIKHDYILRMSTICTEFYNAIASNQSFEILGGELSVFLIIKIKSTEKDIYKKFLEDLDKSLKRKKLTIIHGTSFGFRHPRIEIIQKDFGDNCLRLSLGCYRGLLYEAIKHFFIEWRE